ncbi:MAG TPA: hypothetical protein VLT36_25165 [Candidatus Dormibacteraeota bacterium]|nr:hypothetical protein [Candidatus Dormibacteraeota bacterium]
MSQNGYLFNAGATCSQVRAVGGVRGGRTLQTWDTVMSAIVYGPDVTQAQQTFERWCLRSGGGEDPIETEIKKIVGAQLVAQLLTETGAEPIDWPQFSQRLIDSLLENEPEQDPPSDRGEGYWVDVQEAVSVEMAALEPESLRRGLPEDVASGLNWSTEKNFVFLATCLAPAAVILGRYDDSEESESKEEHGEARVPLDISVTSLPEMRHKEAAALVKARNSVVAGWLWRRFLADGPLARREILIRQCCAILPAVQE